jgi:hypothetical protein
VESDMSNFDASQWKVLSDLIETYDEMPLVALAQRFVDETRRPRTTMTTSGSTFATEFFSKIYETSGSYLRTNRDICQLPSAMRSTLLRSAAECVTCLGVALVCNRAHLNDCQPFIDVLSHTYGNDSLRMIRSVLKFIDADVNIAKLALSMFAFSGTNNTLFLVNEPTMDDGALEISRIQQSYAELTWKYLLYKYGLQQSIQRWIQLIQCHLAATETVHRYQTIEKHVHAMEFLVEETELTLLLDDVDSADDDEP